MKRSESQYCFWPYYIPGEFFYLPAGALDKDVGKRLAKVAATS
jgi:hypothetical protein